MAKVNWQKWAQAGAVYGILAAVISWLYSMFSPNGIAKISFAMADIDVGSSLKSGIDTSFGAKILSPLVGKLPAIGWFGSLIYVAVAGLIVFVLGRYLYEWIPVKGKSKQTKLMWTALWGSLAVGLILAFMAGNVANLITWGYIQLMAGAAIAFLIVALVYVFVLPKVPVVNKLAIIPE